MKKASNIISFLLICLSATYCKKDLELEKLKIVLREDRFQLKNFSVDWNKPLASRTDDLPYNVLQDLIKFDKTFYQNVDYTSYKLSDNEKEVIRDTLKFLPRKYLEVLEKKLIGFYFIKDYKGGGSANWLVDEDNNIYYFIVLNPALFLHSSTEWEMKKIKDVFCYDPKRQIRITFSNKPAIYHILFHETSHVVDMEYRITPYINGLMKYFLFKIRNEEVSESTVFTKGVWSDFNQLEDQDSELNIDFSFYSNELKNKCLDSYGISMVFASLLSSSFVSLYSSKNWTEDFAEISTVYLMNKNFRSRYRIEIIQKGKSFEYEPLKDSNIIQSRIKLIEDYLK